MDPRLALAVEVSRRWYDAVFAAHGIPTHADAELWQALAAPPPLHSAVKSLSPGVGENRVLRAAEVAPTVAVADSFGDWDLVAEGFRVLIDASWIHHPGVPPGPMPTGWARVHDPAGLADWTAGHGSPEVFVPAFTADPSLSLLARVDRDDRLTAGLVLHDAGVGIGLSNSFVTPGAAVLAWDEVLDVIAAVHPDRPVTDYTSDDDLTAAEAAGFARVGPQRVWLRER